MPADSTWAVFWAFAIMPIFISALLNAGEAAVIYVDDSEIRHMCSAGDRKAQKIKKLTESYTALEASTAATGVMCLGVSFYGFLNIFLKVALANSMPLWLTYPLTAIVGGILYIAFGKIAPRRLAAYYHNEFAFTLLWLLQLNKAIMFPVVRLTDFTSSIAIRLAGKNPSIIPHRVTEEEIRMLVDEGEVRGVIEETEKDMINNIFEFDERTVDEVMTHRIEVSAADTGAKLNELVSIALATGYSRIPIYEDNIDSIIGIVHVKDLLRFIGRPEEFLVSKNVRKVLYVPGTTKCTKLFKIFKDARTQIAVVVDEYGGTDGIVTMEDLLESIVGSMQDEYDNESALTTELEAGVYVLDASMTMSEVERFLNIRFPEDSESDTLAGYVTEILGGFPKEDTVNRSVHFGGVTFTVLECDDRKILTIRAVTDKI